MVSVAPRRPLPSPPAVAPPTHTSSNYGNIKLNYGKPLTARVAGGAGAVVKVAYAGLDTTLVVEDETPVVNTTMAS